MKVTYDESVDAVYIYFVDENERNAFDYTYACDPQVVDGQIHLDFDVDGHLIGIEVLQASKKLPHALLKNAIKLAV